MTQYKYIRCQKSKQFNQSKEESSWKKASRKPKSTT